MIPTRKAIPVAALAILLGTIGTAYAGSTSSSPAAKTVKVTLSEFSVKLSTTAIPSGRVNFIVKNVGITTHEFEVARDPGKPFSFKAHLKANVSESMGEVEDVDPGKTKRLTLNLPAGKYVGICNLPGHYKLGMSTRFRIG